VNSVVNPLHPSGRIAASPSPALPDAFPATDLLAWFDRSSRAMPWRRDRDPWRIWVSEAMLQQTLVATVIPFFERFVARFPDPAALARTDEQEALRYWEGLGYYRRIRHLRQAAILVVERHRGEVPDTPEAFAALPGVGRYMAGAVLSQAFEARLPVLEANTRRVLCRLFAVAEDPAKPATQKVLWAHAEAILPTQRIGDFNQAMMELGALVCTVSNPACDRCPLSPVCRSHREGLTGSIPAPSAKATLTGVREVALVVRRDRRVLLVQRPEGGRWAGMWEFPHCEVAADGDPHLQAIDSLKALTGLTGRSVGEYGLIRHGVTRYKIEMHCFEIRADEGEFASAFYVSHRWLTPDELSGVALSSAQRTLAGKLAGGPSQPGLF